MKNTDENLKKIQEINNLNYEVTAKIIELEMKKAEIDSNFKSFLEDILKQYDLDLKDGNAKEKLIESYMNYSPYIGYCHIYWNTKKTLLKEKYNIDWYTPQEENPGTLFD